MFDLFRAPSGPHLVGVLGEYSTVKRITADIFPADYLIKGGAQGLVNFLNFATLDVASGPGFFAFSLGFSLAWAVHPGPASHWAHPPLK